MNTTDNTRPIEHEHDEPDEGVSGEVQTARLKSLRDEGEDIVLKAAAYAASLVAEANITLRQRRKEIAAVEEAAATRRAESETENAKLTAQKTDLEKEIAELERSKRLTAITGVTR